MEGSDAVHLLRAVMWLVFASVRGRCQSDKQTSAPAEAAPVEEATGERMISGAWACRLRRAGLSALLLVTLAHGQYTRTPLRTITGTVTDAGQEPLRGAVVQIEALDTLVIQSYETSESGEYHFRNLRSDADYSIWATFRGNRSKAHGIGKFDHKLDRDIPITVVLEK